MNERANDYVKEWLGPYLDGELSADRRGWVEEHLAGCPSCRQELAELRALTRLLHADPAPAPFLAPEAFARQVLKRLPEPAQPAWRRALRLGLRFAPLWLFGAWAFAQAVILLSSALLYALRLFPQVESWLAALLPGWNASPDELLGSVFGFNLLNGGLIGDLLGRGMLERFFAWTGLEGLAEGIGGSLLFGPLTVINLVILVVLTALFFAWLAGQYAYHRAQTTARELSS